MRLLKRLLVSETVERAHRLYAAVVAVARSPVYYTRYGVADSFDGRFDMIVVHLFLLDSALKTLGEQDVSVAVQEAFIRDMDRNLREMGVGDLSVGKQIKSMGAALLGRLQAYRDAFAADDMRTALSPVVWRNIYRRDEGAPSEACTELSQTLITLGAAWQSLGDALLAADTLPGPEQGS